MRLSNMITAVDAHACGEPGRVITGGVLDPPGQTMFEKLKWLEQNMDGLRLRMLREPRGNPVLCCNLVLPPTHPDADAGFVIMEQTEYPPMSGSNTICTATVLLETGIIPMQEPVTELTLEAPAGLIRVHAECSHGKVTSVTFQNVPAFAPYLDELIDVPHLGQVRVDVAWGGMWFAIAQAADLGLELIPANGREIVRVSEMIKAAARQLPVSHPHNPQVNMITGALLLAPPTHPDAHCKNTMTVSTGTLDWTWPATWTGILDRSPCGTGTCATMAALHAKGQLPLQQDFVNESIISTLFTGRLLEETQVGPYKAVVPTLTGTAWISAITQYVLDPTDPFPEGFTVGDIW